MAAHRLRLLALAAATALALGQTPFENYAPCAPNGEAGRKVTRFQETFVCVTINGVQRAMFNPTADEFTLLNIQDSATSLPAGTGFIEKGVGYLPTGSCNGSNPTLTDFFVTVEVASLGANQVVPYVYQARTCDSAKFFPFLTAVFIVDQGEVISITWDDECAFCNGEAQCQHNGFDNSTNNVLASDLFRECGYTPSQCTALGGGGADCDLRVYLSWVGTDSKGDFFTSGNQRFSRFRQFAIGSLFDAAQQEVSAGANDVQSAGGQAQNIPGEVF